MQIKKSFWFSIFVIFFTSCITLGKEEIIGGEEQAVSTPGNYLPSSSSVAAAASVTINMSYPPLWTEDRSNCSRGLQPGVAKLGEYIKSTFSGVSLIGGYNCRQNSGNGNYISTHGVGWALDIHIPRDNGAADNTIGDPIADWLIANAGTLGVQYLIWDKTQYITSGANRVSTYYFDSDAQNFPSKSPHTDHIHVELAKSYAENPNLPTPGGSVWSNWFDFAPDNNNVYACTDRVLMSDFTCQNRQTIYQSGQNVNLVVRINNVRRNVSFRVEAWRSGASLPDWSYTEPAYSVEPNVWPYAFFLPRFDNVYPGDWEMKIFADVGDGPVHFTSFYFTVPGGSQQWPGSPYEYSGNEHHCKGGVTGGESTGWIYTCNNPQSSYVVGDTVSVMTRIDNVASSHEFKTRIFRSVNNGATWTLIYTTAPVSNIVPAGQTWAHAFYWTNIYTDQPGLYEARIGIDLPGDSYDHPNLAMVQFVVSTSAAPPAAYTYNGNSATCANEPTGGNNTGWIYTCPRPATVFSPLQDIRVFAYVENVRESYKFRTRFYLNGSSTPSEQVETPLQTVPNGEVWGRAYAWPALWNASSGSWRASLEIHTNSTGWQMLKSNITFTVNQPVAGYIPGSLNLCRGSVEPERDSSGVPQCLTPVSSVSPFFTYYWRLHFTSLTSSHQFRVEAYQNGMLSWSYNFGPYSAPSNGHAWFFPQFANPAGPSNWEMLFFVKIGSGNFQQVDAYSFYSL